MTLISKLISSENNTLQTMLSNKQKGKNQKPERQKSSNFHENSLIKMVVFLYEKLYSITSNFEESIKGNLKGYSVYNCSFPPTISLENYMKRIHSYLEFSDEMLLLALVYIDKLMQKTCLKISSQNIHKLFLTSLMLACKFLDDDWESNDYMSKLGGIPLPELNLMEAHFLKDLNYELFIEDKTLVFYHKHIKDFYIRLQEEQNTNFTNQPQ